MSLPEHIENAGLVGADARTRLSNIDKDDPNEGDNGVVRAGYFDYTQERDVDYYIEFTAYKYSRGIGGGAVGRAKQVVIRLPLLSSVTSSYGMEYTNKDMALFYDAAISVVGGVKDLTAGGFTKGIDGIFEGLTEGAGAAAQTVYNGLANGGEYTAQLNNHLGAAKNPRQEASFVGIGMRNHSMGFLLVPRNAKENQLIQDIIYAFKHRMHPDISDVVPEEAFLRFPDEFTISFKSKSAGKHLGIPSIPDCFLANFNVVYNQNGAVRFFDDLNPVSYHIDMGFVEGNQLTRSNIADGGY